METKSQEMKEESLKFEQETKNKCQKGDGKKKNS